MNKLSHACSKPSDSNLAAAERVPCTSRAVSIKKKNALKTSSTYRGILGCVIYSQPGHEVIYHGLPFHHGRRSVSFGSVAQTWTTQPTIEAELVALSYSTPEAVIRAVIQIEVLLLCSDQLGQHGRIALRSKLSLYHTRSSRVC